MHAFLVPVPLLLQRKYRITPSQKWYENTMYIHIVSEKASEKHVIYSALFTKSFTLYPEKKLERRCFVLKYKDSQLL